MKICVVSGKICNKDCCDKKCIDREIMKVILSYFPSYHGYNYKPFIRKASKLKTTEV